MLLQGGSMNQALQSKQALRFKRNDQAGNAFLIVMRYKFGREKNVPVNALIVSCSEGEFQFEVGEGKYKSALFLFDLSRQLPEDTWGQPFAFTSDMKVQAFRYFDDTICKDAVNNPETNHKLLRYLLTGTDVKVTVKVEPHH